MRTPLPFALGSPTVSLPHTSVPGSLPPITTSRYDHQATSEIGTGAPLYLDYVFAPDKKGTERIPMEFQDFTALSDSSFPSTESFIEDITIKGEVEASTDFGDYISTTESTESSTNFDSTDIPLTLENHTDILENYGNLIVFASASVSSTGEKIANESVITEENKSEGKYFNEETFTKNIPSSGEIFDTRRETWEQANIHRPNSDISKNDGYDWFTTHPPTPKADISQESFTADLSNSADTKELNLVLEASPTTELVFDTTEIPLGDLSNFDLKIMTTREGLQVDANDVSFDPGQVAKATSYEGSSYSTATRSATVTTWVDPEDKHMFGQRVNLTKSKTLGGSRDSLNLTSDTELPSSDINLELPTTEDVELKLSIVGTDHHQESASYVPLSDILTSDVDSLTESEIDVTTVATDYMDYGEIKLQEVKLPEITSENNVFNNDVNKNVLEEITIHTFNVADFSNDTKVLIKDNKNKTKDSLIYEIPVLGITGNNDPHLDPSVLIALSVCCCIVLLAVIAIFMWLCRRHRNRSKIYLSREAAKPRAFLTKPMHPALLPNESIPEPLSMVEFQRPRAPILLSDDKEDIYFIEQSPVRESLQVESTAVSVVNNGYNNVSFCESNIENIHNGKRVIQDPPKYDLNYKCESDTDSGIKVWSSSGSLFTTSPQLTHCSVPPPPYSPSVGKESVCLSVHSPHFLNKNRGQLNV